MGILIEFPGPEQNENDLHCHLELLKEVEMRIERLRGARDEERVICAELALTKLRILDLRVSPGGDMTIRIGVEKRGE